MTNPHPAERLAPQPRTAFTRAAFARAAFARAAFTRAARRSAPRRGSLADGEVGRRRLSTGAARCTGWAGWIGWLVVGGGLLFLLGRPALGTAPSAGVLLGVGYLGLLACALAVPARVATAPSPLGWGVPLGLGLAGVVGAGMVAGPVADRRVGVVAAGLAVLAAVAEEALFRRVLYDRLARFGVVVAVVGSAVVFALVHLPAYGVAAMPVDLGAALLLSWQRYASGRWTVPAVTHAVANLLAVT